MGLLCLISPAELFAGTGYCSLDVNTLQMVGAKTLDIILIQPLCLE